MIEVNNRPVCPDGFPKAALLTALGTPQADLFGRTLAAFYRSIEDQSDLSKDVPDLELLEKLELPDRQHRYTFSVDGNQYDCIIFESSDKINKHPQKRYLCECRQSGHAEPILVFAITVKLLTDCAIDAACIYLGSNIEPSVRILPVLETINLFEKKRNPDEPTCGMFYSEKNIGQKPFNYNPFVCERYLSGREQLSYLADMSRLTAEYVVKSGQRNFHPRREVFLIFEILEEFATSVAKGELQKKSLGFAFPLPMLHLSDHRLGHQNLFLHGTLV